MNEQWVDVVRGMATVKATCLSPNHGFPKYPQSFVQVTDMGIVGDAHFGPMRESFNNPGTFKPNDRPISIVAEEARQIANQLPEVAMQPGDFNENLLVEGAGDLGEVEIGDEIAFNNGVILKVVDRAYPCKKLEAYNGDGLIKALCERTDKGVHNRRGVLARVLQTGKIKPDDHMVIIKAEQTINNEEKSS